MGSTSIFLYTRIWFFCSLYNSLGLGGCFIFIYFCCHCICAFSAQQHHCWSDCPLTSVTTVQTTPWRWKFCFPLNLLQISHSFPMPEGFCIKEHQWNFSLFWHTVLVHLCCYNKISSSGQLVVNFCLHYHLGVCFLVHTRHHPVMSSFSGWERGCLWDFFDKDTNGCISMIWTPPEAATS